MIYDTIVKYIGCDAIIPSWCHNIETFSTLLVLCEGNPQVSGKFLLYMRKFDVPFFQLDQNEEQPVELPVVWDTMTPKSL